MPKFPREVFVKWEESGSDEGPFLVTSKNIEGFSEQDSDIKVGVYTLNRVATLSNKTELR